MTVTRTVFTRDVFLILFIFLQTSRSESNLALLKNATQSSDHGDTWTASKVVDNCLDTDIAKDCCTHTEPHAHKEVWWRVDLGELMTVDRITIYYRYDFQIRLAGYHLYLSNITDTPTQGVLCYEDKSMKETEVQLVVTHQCPYVAQYVTVYNYRNNTRQEWYSDYAVLELCEVQVFGCEVGRYGIGDCENLCPDNCYGGNCNSTTGSCLYCFPGNYGINCNNICPVNCGDSICEKDTGFCFRCVSRKHGTTCEGDCPVNCMDTCGQDTGNCNECVSGKRGTTCEDDCPVNCKDTCEQYTGNCNGCVSGKRGTTCEDYCPVNCQDTCEQDTGNCSGCIGGFFGTYCMENCSSNCSECEQESGVCTKCMTGLYGMNCNMSCGHCSICEQNSGVCVTCDPGYEGIYCETKQAEVSDNPTPSTNAGSIAGPIAGVLAILVIAVVIAIYIRRRRQNAGKQDTFDDIGRSNKLHRNGQSKPLETENSRSEPVVPPEHNVYSNVLLDFNEDPDYPTKGTGNVYVNAEQVASASRSGDSVYYNSGPVGFPVSTLKSLVHTKMQNKAKAFENEFKSIPYGALHEHKIGMLPQNKTKNRFKTTFPYDHSRVILDKVRNDPHSDYINANYIDSVTKTAAYIATQGPRTGTVNDFWRMIWQLKSDKIVMLTNVVEEGRPKCDKYWPDEGEPLATPHFNIILDRERTYAFYVLRDLKVTEKKTKSERQIHQFHYTTWPDHGTPDSNELVVFHRRVKHYPSALPGKMVIHCSAGIGRTGTFIALDALLDYGKEFEQVDVLQYIKTMRKDRMNMVQTNEQYIAIHQLLAEAFDLPDTLIPRMTYDTTLNTLSNGGPTNQTKLRKEYHQIQPLKPHYGETECKAALLPNNKMKNKISTVLAADKFRAYLRSQANGRTDYINAVVVPSYTSQTGYIVTQTPTEDTVVDLLTMIMDHDCTTIVIIDTDTIVWLPEQGKDKSIGEFTLEHKGNSSTVTDVDLIEISIENEMKGFHVKVRVFHLTGWEQESSVPQDSSALLQLLELVDSRRKSDNTKTTAVMCRDGFSQSGLFCCISNARDQMKGDDEVDIFQITRQLQVRRPEFIVNFDQYQFCYNMIKEYLDTTDVYMN